MHNTPAGLSPILTAILLSSLLLSPAQSHAATETTDTTSKTAPTPKPTPVPEINNLFQVHYEARVRSFSEQNQVHKNVVLLGDSITEGFTLKDYLPGRRVINRGIGGDIIGNDAAPGDKRGLLNRLNESVFDCAPTHLFILIGINDIGQGHTPEQVEKGYRELLIKIRERMPQLKIYVQSLLPTRDRFDKHNPAILDANERLKKVASEFNCEYLDLHTAMADDEGKLKADWTNDGLHIKEPAYKAWAEIVEEHAGWK